MLRTPNVEVLTLDCVTSILQIDIVVLFVFLLLDLLNVLDGNFKPDEIEEEEKELLTFSS